MPLYFPYKYEIIDSKKIPYARVPVTLPLRMGNQKLSFIVDSGADMLTLPKYFKFLLKIDMDKVKISECQGVGKQLIKTWETDIKIEFCWKKIVVPISITDNNETPLLLGKLGIWDKFNVNFNNVKKRVEFEEI